MGFVDYLEVMRCLQIDDIGEEGKFLVYESKKLVCVPWHVQEGS